MSESLSLGECGSGVGGRPRSPLQAVFSELRQWRPEFDSNPNQLLDFIALFAGAPSVRQVSRGRGGHPYRRLHALRCFSSFMRAIC